MSSYGGDMDGLRERRAQPADSSAETMLAGHGEPCKDAEQRTAQRTTPAPQLLRYRNVPTALTTAKHATRGDPMNLYIKDSAGTKQGLTLRGALRAALMYAMYARDAYQGAIWTVHGGASWMRLGDPQRTPGPLVRTLDRALAAALAWTFTGVQLKRRTEYKTKRGAALQGALGARMQEMLSVGGLATHPAWQGRGYASALVRVVADLADARGAACWLVSSNVGNRAFYRARGFEVVRTFVIGEADAAWGKPPVPIEIMVREPRGRGE
ncbi:GNAT family N-acetyltransferase [Phanerochaete sordida]|uniref:GNAT family N-acetyltransferase n=1 Tax=Phanerochaete sordida TaxID=48140 RepID=A0A9P3GIJ2_9APHY|nr:GNAT family N-acetyltransferase [Phanerochaete sordida]